MDAIKPEYFAAIVGIGLVALMAALKIHKARRGLKVPFSSKMNRGERKSVWIYLTVIVCISLAVTTGIAIWTFTYST